jgi:prepilin-type N-terminal cleavage/methylation domain-containing protein
MPALGKWHPGDPMEAEQVEHMRGFSLVELLVVMALLSLFAVMATANLSATQRRLDFDEFAREIVDAMEMCRWKALNERRYTGILVEHPGTAFQFSFYRDGNKNGIRTAEIQSGLDPAFLHPIYLNRALGDMEAAALDSPVPEIPPKKGLLDPNDPVKFGQSSIISFSPDGQSSSGTIYLACHSQQRMYAIVLYGPTARLTLWKFFNAKWQMVGDR